MTAPSLHPDDEHRRPDGADDRTVDAVGKLSEAVRQAEHDVREKLVDGRRHVFEAELKERRRTPRHPGHESRPPITDGD